MFIQVDQLGSRLDCLESGLFHTTRRADKRDHGPVVVMIHMTVQDKNLLYTGDRFLDGVNDFWTPGIRKIGDAFN